MRILKLATVVISLIIVVNTYAQKNVTPQQPKDNNSGEALKPIEPINSIVFIYDEAGN